MSLDDNIRALARTPVLADIGRDALRLLAFSVEEIELRSGDLLFENGEEADGAYCVIRGRIRLDSGKGEAKTVGRGALIGELALIVETERPCEAVAIEDTKLLSIPRPVFRKVLEEFPAIAKQMRHRLSGKLRAEHAALERLQSQIDRLPGAKAEN
ncbi:cyclic nucleotide-binding protein [Terrihabitans soli]|uniref:Cyclic nucleotide-binding protein n=1 Tax=Terrihabitans soli TaxID=708113 RepID=A0A6S6QN41_9HYPH|nr:cyclic nucleotide-binding domain-containing protein [Terrihabitans soli]BCJ89337.1 cyclic nucleotide-binding protein [Terrihabitans soli]